MNQISIQAYFLSPTAAQSIETKLKALRALDVQIDRVELPVNNSGAGATLLTMGNEQLDGLNPDLFGSRDLDNNEFSVVNETGVLLKAVIDQSSYEQTLRVIREGGGVI